MELMEAIRTRHSVRQYTNEPLRAEHIAALEREIARCNQKSGLHIQLITNEPKAFSGLLSHYGWLRGVTDYIALVGKDNSELEELCGYYGEHLVLKAQQLGMNTCWVGGTYRKKKAEFQVAPGEKLCLVIAVGYGENQGKSRRSKTYDQVAEAGNPVPDWFSRGVEAALLAPTAVNQQKFRLILRDGKVEARAGTGPLTKVDLGIVKYHFEVGAGKEHVIWKDGES